MQLSTTFRHMDASQAVREYAEEKLEKVRKYFHKEPIAAHAVFSVERGFHHVADINITLPNGLVVNAKETTEDMYSSIDLVMAKIERQVRRHKDKIRHHKAREGLSEMSVHEHVLESDGQNGTQAANEQAPPVQKAKITKTDSYAAQALHVDEAVMQLDLLHQNFLVFKNPDTGTINVVYRREDGNYGLIETQPAAS